MKSLKISLEMAQKVKEFVALTQDCPYEVLLKSGKYVVDAKSILGIFSLDLSQPLTGSLFRRLRRLFEEACRVCRVKQNKRKLCRDGR